MANNYAGSGSERARAATDPARRASAYHAWWEHMPVRLEPPTPGDEYVIYRTISWGELLDLHMLDGTHSAIRSTCMD